MFSEKKPISFEMAAQNNIFFCCKDVWGKENDLKLGGGPGWVRVGHGALVRSG